jgi:hypothetical protein
MTPRAFAIVMLAFFAALTAIVALYAQPVNSLGSFPVENPIQMSGKDCK